MKCKKTEEEIVQEMMQELKYPTVALTQTGILKSEAVAKLNSQIQKELRRKESRRKMDQEAAKARIYAH